MIDVKKLQEQGVQPLKDKLWIATARISRRIPGKFTQDELGQMQVLDPITNAWFIDVTTRGQHPLWAPGWDIVVGHKNGTVSDEEYTKAYVQRLRDSYRAHKTEWVALLQLACESERRIVLCCFCAPGGFCHRYILADVLAKVAVSIGIPVHPAGEWFEEGRA